MHHQKREKIKPHRNLEESFSLKRMIKNNKQFYDIQMVDKLEKKLTKKRRVPVRKGTQDVQERINDSFMDTTAAFSFNIESNIEKYKLRVSKSMTIPRLETQEKERQHSIFSKQKSKQKNNTLNWGKMTSRDRGSMLRQKSNNHSEERYNNFYLTSYHSSRTRSFDKYLSRFSTQPIPQNQSSIDTDKVTKSKQKFKYDETTMAWNYKQQKYDRGPIYYKTPKEHSFRLNHIPEERITRAIKKITPKWNKALNNFTKLSSKDNPCQFQRNFHTPKQNYRERKHEYYVKPESKRIRIKEERGFVQFKKQEICDDLFFRRKTLREKKVKRLLTQ